MLEVDIYWHLNLWFSWPTKISTTENVPSVILYVMFKKYSYWLVVYLFNVHLALCSEYWLPCLLHVTVLSPYSDSHTCWPTHRLHDSILSDWSLCSHTSSIPKLWLGKWLWQTLVERWQLYGGNFIKENKIRQDYQHTNFTGTSYWGKKLV